MNVSFKLYMPVKCQTEGATDRFVFQSKFVLGVPTYAGPSPFITRDMTTYDPI